VMLLVTPGGTLALLGVGRFGAAGGTRDPVHQQGECLLKFGDALTMAVDFLQECASSSRSRCVAGRTRSQGSGDFVCTQKT
jgi:hypothetical protein